jgi:hypothetical protein
MLYNVSSPNDHKIPYNPLEEPSNTIKVYCHTLQATMVPLSQSKLETDNLLNYIRH